VKSKIDIDEMTSYSQKIVEEIKDESRVKLNWSNIKYPQYKVYENSCQAK